VHSWSKKIPFQSISIYFNQSQSISINLNQSQSISINLNQSQSISINLLCHFVSIKNPFHPKKHPIHSHTPKIILTQTKKQSVSLKAKPPAFNYRPAVPNG